MKHLKFKFYKDVFGIIRYGTADTHTTEVVGKYLNASSPHETGYIINESDIKKLTSQGYLIELV